MAVAGAAVAATTASPALAAPANVEVITGGLNGPFGIQSLGKIGYVAENAAGQVTRVYASGNKKVVFGNAAGVAGAAGSSQNVFAVMGGPNETGEAPPSAYDPATVLRSNYSGSNVKVIADLLDYELKNNPDGQKQFDEEGVPFDALSNPFAMNYSSKYGLLVADGGANDVLKVNPTTGKVSTFFVPPNIQAPGCEQANPGSTGCDPVPTGVDVVGGHVYVSTLGAEVPGAGRVYKLDQTGKVLKTWGNLTAPTGVAVSPGGIVYVSEVFANGETAQDPADIGQITKIAPNGRRTHAQVTMPTGLDYVQGKLLSTTWSVAFFFGIADAGQVVWVKPGSFS